MGVAEQLRSALRTWLDQPTAGPRLEWEALIQVAFADNGTREHLLANLKAIRAEADRTRDAAYCSGVRAHGAGAGWMFLLWRNTFSGSYLAFSSASRQYVLSP